jgi:hypothetical protein
MAKKKQLTMTSSTGQNAEQQSRQITRMVAILMITLLGVQSLVPVREIVGAVIGKDQYLMCGSFLYLFDPIVNNAQTMASSLNLFIYILNVERFRKRFFGLLKSNAVDTENDTPH